MRAIVEHCADHDVFRHELTADDRARAAAEMIDRLVPHYAVGMHAADPSVLAHEAERLDCLPHSAVTDRMQAIVAAEQAERARRVITAGIVSQLEAMARQWDRCAANSAAPTYLNGNPSQTYRAYAAACREKAKRLRAELDTRPGPQAGA